MGAKATTRASKVQEPVVPQEQPPSIPEQPQLQVPATVLLLQQMVAQLEQLNATLKPLIGLVPKLSALTLTTGEIRDLLIDRSFPSEDEKGSLLNASSYSYSNGDELEADAFLENLEDMDDDVSLQRAAMPAPQTRAHNFMDAIWDSEEPLPMTFPPSKARRRGVKA